MKNPYACSYNLLKSIFILFQYIVLYQFVFCQKCNRTVSRKKELLYQFTTTNKGFWFVSIKNPKGVYFVDVAQS